VLEDAALVTRAAQPFFKSEGGLDREETVEKAKFSQRRCRGDYFLGSLATACLQLLQRLDDDFFYLSVRHGHPVVLLLTSMVRKSYHCGDLPSRGNRVLTELNPD
jgi:hypothetical protein